MRLQTRIFIFVFSISVVCSLVLFSEFSYYSQKLSEKIVTKLISNSASQTSLNIQKFLQEKVGDLTLLSANPVFSKTPISKNEISKLFIEIRNTYKNYEALEYVTNSYITLVHTNRVGLDEISENRDIIERAKSDGKTKADFVISKKFKRSYARICIPVLKGNKTLGFIIGLIPLERVSEYFSIFDSDFGGLLKPKVDMIYSDGTIIYENHAGEDHSYINKAIKQLNGTDEKEFLIDNYYVFISQSFELDHTVFRDWYFVIHFNYSELTYPLINLKYSMIILGILIFVLVFIWIRSYTEKILRPLVIVDRKFESLSQGRFEKIEIDHSNIYEFKRLSNAYNAMLVRLMNTMMELNQKSKFEALGQMAGGIAHEINNPLSIIKGHGERLVRLLSNEKNLDTALTNSAEIIILTTDRLSRIVNSLRTFSRENRIEPFELATTDEIVDMTLDLCSEKMKNNGIDLRVTNLLVQTKFECRPIQISQVLLNLISNAFDAIKALPEKWIEVQISKNENQIQFKVINSGPKISKEIIDKIFIPFFTTKSASEGTGLGLSISKGIAESHDGKLYLDDTHENTCFVLELPLQKSV